MPKTPQICDANILIDMEVAGLLETMFHLDYVFGIPDLLFHDELAERHSHLPGMGLVVHELSADGIQLAAELSDKYASLRVSRYDLFALALAQQEQCPLLTGDSDLRLAGDEEGVQVHGTLWLMSHLLDAGLIDCKTARDAYDSMRKRGRRLPWKEVKEQLRRFCHEIANG